MGQQQGVPHGFYLNRLPSTGWSLRANRSLLMSFSGSVPLSAIAVISIPSCVRGTRTTLSSMRRPSRRAWMRRSSPPPISWERRARSTRPSSRRPGPTSAPTLRIPAQTTRFGTRTEDRGIKAPLESSTAGGKQVLLRTAPRRRHGGVGHCQVIQPAIRGSRSAL